LKDAGLVKGGSVMGRFLGGFGKDTIVAATDSTATDSTATSDGEAVDDFRETVPEITGPLTDDEVYLALATAIDRGALPRPRPNLRAIAGDKAADPPASNEPSRLLAAGG
jgi:hypothetical protein